MYVGTHYNSYYNTLFPNSSSIYTSYSKKNQNSIFSSASGVSSNSATQYLQNLKNGSSSLSKAISSLSSGFANTLVSSNSQAMSVKTSGSSSLSTSLSVKIDQIASGQVNSGTALSANAKSSSNGYQQFSIDANGKTYQFSLSVGAGDSNKSVQEKMAAAINMRSIGISASVVTDAKTGMSTLKLESQNTGNNAKSQFQISDVYGDVVAKTGADKVEQKAQDAVYSVNGGEQRTSQTNTVNLGNGVTATLLKASDEKITVSKGTDKDAAVSKVKELASSYNQLYGAAFNNIEDSKSNRLFSQLSNASQSYSAALSKIGISFNGNGYMQVDEEKVGQAAEDGSLQKFFTTNSNNNYGYTAQLNRIASSVSTNTSQYVSSNALGDNLSSSVYSEYFSNSSYSNYFNTSSSFFSTYQNFANNGTFNSGLLFDLLL